MPLGYHVMCRLEDSRVIAPTVGERRLLARIVLQIGQPHGLLAFNGVDTHLHFELACPRLAPMEVARRIECALKRRLRLAKSFVRPTVKNIGDQGYLKSCFRYVFRQHERHGLDWDPYFEASNLPDLLGMRLLGQQTLVNVRQQLPRVGRSYLLAFIGIDRLDPADGPVDRLLEAAASVVARDHLDSRLPDVVEVKRALVALVGKSLPVQQLANMLGVTRRAISRLRGGPRDQRYLSALRLQLGLRSALAQKRKSGASHGDVWNHQP